MALSDTVFSGDKNSTVAPTPSSLMARLGMTVCFVAAAGLLIAGLVRNMPRDANAASQTSVMTMTAENPKSGVK
jgi:hypothetical protein